jgi:hypothetical protein
MHVNKLLQIKEPKQTGLEVESSLANKVANFVNNEFNHPTL